MHAVVIGHGSIGRRHADNLRKLGCEVVTVDPVAEADYDSVGLALEAHGKDALVIIASPTKEHLAQALYALDFSPKAIYLEKPPCITSNDGLEKLKDKPVIVGFNWRFHPAIDMWRGSGATNLDFYAWDNILNWPTFSPGCYAVDPVQGGVVLISAVHSIDLAIHLLGTPMAVGGQIAYARYGIFEGMDVFSDIEIVHFSGLSGIRNIWGGGFDRGWIRSTIDGKDVKTDLRDFTWATDMHLEAMRAFIHFAETGEPGYLCTIPQAMQVMWAVDALRLSAASGKAVNID